MDEAFRPTVASRRTGRDVVGAIVDLTWLRARTAAWDRLAAEAADPNPFFTRHVIEAHAAHGLAGRDLRFAVVHDGEELLALMPVRGGGARVGWWRRAGVAWSSPFTTNATPLVAGGEVERIVAVLLDALGSSGPRLWTIPLLALDRPVGRALLAAVGARGWGLRILSEFERAVLDARSSYDAFARDLRPNRRKQLGRLRRRLGEMGELRHEGVTSGEGLRAAIEEFLDLEAGGWKGRRATALASRPETAAFARQLFGTTAEPVTARADMLRLDGRPIAASLALVCGGTAHLLKTAYDENLRTYAPGIVLEDDIVRALHVTGFAVRLDSASLPGGVLDGLYPDRERIGTVLFGCDPSATEAMLDALARQEATVSALRERLKALRRTLSDTMRPGRAN